MYEYVMPRYQVRSVIRDASLKTIIPVGDAISGIRASYQTEVCRTKFCMESSGMLNKLPHKYNCYYFLNT